jgi:hypothetical protein
VNAVGDRWAARRLGGVGVGGRWEAKEVELVE